MAYLITEVGSVVGQRTELSRDEMTIGRYADCDIELKEKGRVSRYHAQLLKQDGNYFVKDLGSRNGTFVNDQQVDETPHPLEEGDRLRISDLVFVFHNDIPRQKPIFPARPTGTSTIDGDSSSPGVLLVDEATDDTSSSTIMSKVNVTASSGGGLHLTASMESRLAALMEITRSLGRALALDEVLPQVLHSLFKIFLQADRGFVVLETEDGELIPRWTKARKGDDETIRISKTIVRQVMETREAVLSEDATSQWTDVSQSITDLRIRSMMCAPLLDSEGNALGVIQLDTQDQRKQFQKEDLEVLASVAIQAGIAIHNAQLHERELVQMELQQDLELATEVQKAFLPSASPELPDYEFASHYSPANHVGGDYYDYIPMPDGRIAIIVADVVGHGIAAAMMMARVAAEAKYCLASEHHPATAVSRLNNRITALDIERFVTMIFLVLEPTTHEVTIVNCGHMAPIWKKANGEIAEPGEDAAGLPVGIIGDFEYEQATIQLQAGDILVMYTDGVNEAMNPEGKQYTIERLREMVARDYGDLNEMRQTIMDDVKSFMDGASPTDDMCLVCLQRAK